MKTFYITFGQKYRNEQHPMWKNTKTQYIHPDGYWEVNAPDYESAREGVFRTLGKYWAFLYEIEPDKNIFPLGKIGQININEI